MEFVICALVVIVVFLCVKTYNLSRRIEKEQQDHRNAIKQNQSRIDSLTKEKTVLQKQINSLASNNLELRTKISKDTQEISHLQRALSDSERKLAFYTDIESASGDLNAPSSPTYEELEAQNGNVLLDSEQAAVCSEIETTNSNFFITGKAGTGKSFLLSALKKRTTKSHIVLAPTGIAALNVGGATLHSTFGYYNLVNLDVDEISIENIRLKSEKRIVLRHVSTIIIDEISMVRADTFEKIDRILKAINNNDRPFGGKQIVLFGDLFQLPPIAQAKEREYLLDRYGGLHFFCAHAYQQANFHFRELTINHRQKEDSAYFETLNRVRDGSVTAKDIETLNARVVQDRSVYDRFTTLLPTKAEVDKTNQYHISQLPSKEYTYHATIIHDKYPNKQHTLEALFPITDTLRLKHGALVMMVANDPERRWVNGSLGIVENLSSKGISISINKNTYEIHPVEFSEQEVTFQNGKLIYEDVLTVVQYPVVPAYAITIHKSQGQTYKNIVCDIDRCFADGQAYVALSRCSSLEGLHLVREINSASIRVDKNVLNFYHNSIVPNNDSSPVN